MIKKTVSLILLFTLLIGGISVGQDKDTDLISEQKVNPWSFGVNIKAAVNWANLNVMPPIDRESTPLVLPNFGYGAGLVVERHLIDNLFAEVGAGYIKRTLQGEIDDNGDFTLEMNIIEFPILLNYKLLANENRAFYVQAGMFFNFAYSGVETVILADGREEGNIQEVMQDIVFGSENGQTRPDDLGAVLGLGVEYKRLRIGVSLDVGVNDYNNYQADYKARSGNLSLTYFWKRTK